jgi:CheY-like chemotaxis protein
MKKNLLLIDDDQDEFAIFMDALNDLHGSFKCDYAGSAEQALELLQSRVPDFIFVDFNMPNFNGLQLLSVIKGEPKLKKSKIFLYSGNISEETHKMARIFGAAGCIEKPGTINKLIHNFKAIFAGELMPEFAYLKGA